MTSCKGILQKKYEIVIVRLTSNILDSISKDCCLSDNFDDPIQIRLFKQKISFNYEMFEYPTRIKTSTVKTPGDSRKTVNDGFML